MKNAAENYKEFTTLNQYWGEVSKPFEPFIEGLTEGNKKAGEMLKNVMKRLFFSGAASYVKLEIEVRKALGRIGQPERGDMIMIQAKMEVVQALESFRVERGAK